MLYLSRVVEDDRFGIVDTDDNVETVVTRTQLSEIAVELKLPVAGVTIMQGNMGWYIKQISVWQDNQYSTQLQIKTKTLLSIDVTLFKDEIVGIKVLKPLQQEVVLKLSDYAKKVSTFAMIRGTRGGFGVVLKFDDSLIITGDCFISNAPGVKFDVRDVTKWDILRSVYEYIVEQYPADVTTWRSNILDLPSRSAFWTCVCLCTSKDDRDYKSLEEIAEKSDKATLCRQLEEYFEPEFCKLAAGGFGYVQVAHRSATAGFVLKKLPVGWGLDAVCNDFEIAIRRLWEIDDLRGVCEYLDPKAPIRMLNYASVFDVSDHIKQLCLKYYRNLCDTVIAFCKSVNIDYKRYW